MLICFINYIERDNNNLSLRLYVGIDTWAKLFGRKDTARGSKASDSLLDGPVDALAGQRLAVAMAPQEASRGHHGTPVLA